MEVRLPDFFGVALRETDIVAKLLAFTSDITFFHSFLFAYSSSILLFFTLLVNPLESACILICMIEISSLVQIAIFVVLLFISVAFHEMMHAYVAYRLGDDLAHSHGRISLNPLRHIDPVLTIALPAVMLLLGVSPILAAKPVPINVNRISGDELGLAAVGVAGPLTNLLLASIGAIVLNVMIQGGGLAYDIVDLFVRLNVALFVFNMLPLPPLDGSRLLYAVAPRPLQRAMEQIEQMGIFVTLMLLFLLLPILSPALATLNNLVLSILIR